MKKSDWKKMSHEEKFSPENISEAMMAVLDHKPLKWEEEGALEDQNISVMFHDLEQHADSKILEKLSALGDQLENMAWNIGWLTDRLYRNLIANKYDVDYLFVCYYVAVTRLKNQRSMNTVKRWALTARFFPEKIARQYNYDVLPMSHFAYAATFGNIKIGRQLVWQAVLDWSWNYYTTSPVSKYCSVAELKNKFEGRRLPSKKFGASPATADFVPDSSSSVDSISMSDVPVAGVIASASSEMVTAIVKGVIDNFTMAVSNYLPALARKNQEIGSALAGVVHNLELIASKLEE